MNRGEAVLCVVHFPANVGFAWNYFEGLYADIATELKRDGIRTFVCYPVIEKPPRLLQGTNAEPLLLDARLDSFASIRATIREIRRLNIRTVYFTDRGWWHWSFPLLRAAGVRRIVAHDHTSGGRTLPGPVKRVAKVFRGRLASINADLIIAVSEYVRHRHLDVNLIPPERVARLWYGITLPDAPASAPPPIEAMNGARPVVLCVCRAAREKGVDHLIRAFDKVIASLSPSEPRPVLVFVGDGPELETLRALAASLPARDDMHLVGYREDVPRFLAHATVSVVPSVWQDACPLGVLEPMAHAKPVVASAVGGVPDEINGPDVGQLVPPGDSDALAAAIIAFLRDPARRASVGAAARKRIVTHFDREQQIKALVALVRGT